MDTSEIVLLGLAAWSVVALVGCAVLLPLFRMAVRGDATQARVFPLVAVPDPAPAGVHVARRGTLVTPALRSPAQVGYAGLVLHRLVCHASTALGMESACVLALEEHAPERVVAVAGHGVDDELVGSRLELPGGVIGACFNTGVTAAGRGVESRWSSSLPDTACAPIFAGGRLRAALAVGGGGARTVTPVDLELLNQLATFAGALLDHHDERSLPCSDPRSEIVALIGALEAADGHTGAHCDLVAALALRVGEELGLAAIQLYELELAARLHDVGKARVPQELLAKPGRLTDSEMDLMRLHPAWGAEIVARIPGLEAVAALVWLHHERIDGLGYPLGLPGERIPIESRIVAACDVYGAIVADRPYRAGRSPDEAVAELKRSADTQLDADAVDALARILEREGELTLTPLRTA